MRMSDRARRLVEKGVRFVQVIHSGNYGFKILMAGGGAKPGTNYGATDDFGFKVAQNPVDVHDPHATVLRLLGMNHENLTFRYAGRDFRLAEVEGKVVADLIA